jgi:hypothetical protein
VIAELLAGGALGIASVAIGWNLSAIGDRIRDGGKRERIHREALDELWSELTAEQIAMLSPECVAWSKRNHERLWHGGRQS